MQTVIKIGSYIGMLIAIGIVVLMVYALMHSDEHKAKKKKDLSEQGYTPTQVDSVIKKDEFDLTYYILLAG